MQYTGAIRVGQLLVATEPGRGGYFDRTVVLLIEHHEEATVGVCLNLVSETPVVSILDGFADHVGSNPMAFEGGPVNLDMVVALGEPATPEGPPPGWARIADDVGLVDVSFPTELLATSFRQVRVFVGLSCWSPGQLEGELIRGSWFRTPVRSDDVFGDPDGLWRRVLRRMGGPTGRWSTWVDDPSLN